MESDIDKKKSLPLYQNKTYHTEIDFSLWVYPSLQPTPCPPLESCRRGSKLEIDRGIGDRSPDLISTTNVARGAYDSISLVKIF